MPYRTEPRGENRSPARPGRLLALLLVCVSASGASCPRIVQQYTQPIPRALPPSASLAQIVDVVNDNSARVQSLSATRATISTPGFPSLNANIALARPRSLRIVGEKFGPQLDVGSNDELLWIWLAQRSRRRCSIAGTSNMPPAQRGRSCPWSRSG